MICTQSRAASLMVRSGSVQRGTIFPSSSPWIPSSRDDYMEGEGRNKGEKERGRGEEGMKGRRREEERRQEGGREGGREGGKEGGREGAGIYSVNVHVHVYLHNYIHM